VRELIGVREPMMSHGDKCYKSKPSLACICIRIRKQKVAYVWDADANARNAPTHHPASQHYDVK